MLGNEFVFPGVFFEESCDLSLVLGGEDGAGGVEELAAGLEHFRILGEELCLDGADSVEGGGFEPPFEVGLAFQRAEAGAGGVDEQGVGDVFEIGGGRFGDRFRGDGGGAGAPGAWFEGDEFFRLHVHGEDAGFVVGEGGEVECFAAGAGAGVDDALAGLRIEQRGNVLRGGILDLDATVEAEGFGEDFPGRESQRVRIAIDGGGLDVVLREPCDGFLDGAEEAVDAEEDGRFLVEGGKLGLPEIAEFGVAQLVKPIGDGLADGARLIREGLLAGDDFLGREAVVFVPLRELEALEYPLGGDE